jgi:tRNA threonylcarbamoyladenosine modification (KEOPS) complex  Pcc1 subunit
MKNNSHFTIESKIELNFNNSQIRDISYNSFIPEIKKLQTNRSKVLIDKQDDCKLVFKVESCDITAFRASMNEIISFGKVIDSTVQIAEIS